MIGVRRPAALVLLAASVVLTSCATGILFDGETRVPISSRETVEAFLSQASGGLDAVLRGIAFLGEIDDQETRGELLARLAELVPGITDEAQRAIVLLHIRKHVDAAFPGEAAGTVPGAIIQDPASLQRGETEKLFAWYYRVRAALYANPARGRVVLSQPVHEALVIFARQGSDNEFLRFLGEPEVEAPGFDALLGSVVTIYLDEGIQNDGRLRLMVGSGFFLDPDGHILTNYHVIQSQVDPAYKGKSKLTIRINRGDGREDSPRIPAQVVGWDSVLDLAVLKTEVPVPGYSILGGGGAVRPGQRIYAIGSPGGLEATVTAGVVSAFGRRFLQLGEVYQVDVPINPGNSGGPVYDEAGSVIGVAFAGIPQFEGISFIIPAGLALLNVTRLAAGGMVEMPWIGVSVFEHGTGFYVSFVHPEAARSSGGLETGAIITRIDGRQFQNLTQLQLYLLGKKTGELAAVAFVPADGGPEREVLVKLAPRPEVPLKVVLGPAPSARWLVPLFGIEVSRLADAANLQRYRIERVFPGTAAEQAGLSEHDTFSFIRWVYDKDNEVVALVISIERINAGLVPQGLQLATFIRINSFI